MFKFKKKFELCTMLDQLTSQKLEVKNEHSNPAEKLTYELNIDKTDLEILHYTYRTLSEVGFVSF